MIYSINVRAKIKGSANFLKNKTFDDEWVVRETQEEKDNLVINLDTLVVCVSADSVKEAIEIAIKRLPDFRFKKEDPVKVEIWVDKNKDIEFLGAEITFDLAMRLFPEYEKVVDRALCLVTLEKKLTEKEREELKNLHEKNIEWRTKLGLSI